MGKARRVGTTSMCKATLAAPSVSVTAQITSLAGKLPHPPNPLSAFLGSFVALGGIAFCEHFLRLAGVDEALLFIGSFGALATLLFGAPAAPLGKPKNVL